MNTKLVIRIIKCVVTTAHIMKKNQSTENNSNAVNKNQLINGFIYSYFHILLAVALFAYNINNEDTPTENEPETITKKSPIYWPYYTPGREKSMVNVHPILQSFGYEIGSSETDWDLLWAYDSVFPVLNSYIKSMKPHQLVNQIPGTHFIAHKGTFSMMTSKYIPKSFGFPANINEFYKYAEENPNSVFVYKNNHHGEVRLVDVKDINVKNANYFAQEYIEKPHLIDGYKYDIGIFIVITSVDPLRIYAYKGDMLYRFCAKKYRENDLSNLDRYIVDQNQKYPKDIPALIPVKKAGYSDKNAVEKYILEQGEDPAVLWPQVEDFMFEIYHTKLHHMLREVKNFASPTNFFQLLRFDIFLDEDLNMKVMEFSFTPNLTKTTEEERIFYKQIIYNTLTLVGAGRHVTAPSLAIDDKDINNMQAADMNILTSIEECSAEVCNTSCEGVCALCTQCLSKDQRAALIKAYKEHTNRSDCRRIFPPSMVQGDDLNPPELKDFLPNDKLMYMWFQAKCNEDVTFCT